LGDLAGPLLDGGDIYALSFIGDERRTDFDDEAFCMGNGGRRTKGGGHLGGAAITNLSWSASRRSAGLRPRRCRRPYPVQRGFWLSRHPAIPAASRSDPGCRRR